VIDRAKLDAVREMMDDYAVEQPCPCCGRPNVGKFFIRELIGGRQLDADPELIRVFTRHYRCEACDKRFHVTTDAPERELMETP
jgi:transposase